MKVVWCFLLLLGKMVREKSILPLDVVLNLFFHMCELTHTVGIDSEYMTIDTPLVLMNQMDANSRGSWGS